MTTSGLHCITAKANSFIMDWSLVLPRPPVTALCSVVVYSTRGQQTQTVVMLIFIFRDKTSSQPSHSPCQGLLFVSSHTSPPSIFKLSRSEQYS